ncbi:MAG: Crp/Fnr family transcriptional regulator [Cyanophyceae cyanobacterium]
MDLLSPASLPLTLRQAVTIQNLVDGQSLFCQGDVATAFFMLNTGRVRLIRNTLEERVALLQVARQSDSLGEEALVADSYSCTAIADTESQVIVYPKPVLLPTLRDYPELAEDLIAKLAFKIQALYVRLELQDMRTAHRRVHQYLRYLARSNDNVITLDSPLKDVATELGFTPETLSRALKRLEQEGSITRSGRSIRLNTSSVA